MNEDLKESVDFMEIFSPPRVVKQCEAFGLAHWASMGLMTGWNFCFQEERERAMKKVRGERLGEELSGLPSGGPKHALLKKHKQGIQVCLNFKKNFAFNQEKKQVTVN